MGGGGKGGDEGGTSQMFSQDVWGPQGDALTGMYTDMYNVFHNTAGSMQDRAADSADYMNRVRDMSDPYWQQQMSGGAYQGMDLQNMYQNALNTGGGNEAAMNEMLMGGAGNDYAQAMKNQLAADSRGQLGQALASNDARAAGMGMSGSSRHGITESGLYRDAQDRLADQQTNIGFNTFDKDLDRKLGIAQRADTYDMNRLQNVSNMLGSQQGAMSSGLGYGSNMQNLGMGVMAPYMAPWQAAGQYANILGRPTILGSGEMSATPSGGGGGKGLGSMVGSVAGGFFGGPAGAAAGGALGGSLDG